MPSMYELPGYFWMMVISFWAPTAVMPLAIWMWTRHPAVQGRWPIKVASLAMAMNVFLVLVGFLKDWIWLHTLAINIGLAISIVTSSWAMVMMFSGRKNSKEKKGG